VSRRLAPLALAGLLAAGRPAPAQEVPTFGVDVAVVRVEALVTDRGRPVKGLRAADFEVLDEGRPQAIEPLLEERAPVDAVLVLDSSYSVSGAKLAALREAAGALLDGLGPDETATLLTFRYRTTLAQPPTLDKERVRGALAQVRPSGGTALRDAVYASLRVRDASQRRTAVVVFSDGLDNLSWLGADDVLEAARRSEAIVYAVSARASGDRGDTFLRDVAAATGGRFFTVKDAKGLRASFLDVLEDIRARYVLSFAPSPGAPGWHALQVRLRNRKKGEVLARPGYWSRVESR
jgi:Ca-activated chloride channel homolog